MRRLPLAGGRALRLCVWTALVLVLGGCASAASSSSVSGHTLTIYLSQPPGRLSAEEMDVFDAEQLALRQAGGRMGSFTLRVVPVHGGELSANARAAIADPTTIAYLGELVPGSSEQTVGITNAEDVLQVSPTDTALELTQSTPAVPGAPDTFYESLSTYGRTFARVVPTDGLEARALVGEMRALGVGHLYIAIDGSDYGRALAAAVRADAAGITLTDSAAGADGILYAGTSMSGATQTFDRAAGAGSPVKLFAPSALADQTFAAGLSPAAQRDLYLSSPGFTAADLPAAGARFASAFRTAYGHPPSAQAIFGYAAAQALLAALRRAGKAANDRGTVVHDFLSLKQASSVLGSYSIDKRGDIVLSGGAPFVISRVRNGRLVAVKAVHE